MKKIVVFFTNDDSIKNVLSGRPKPIIKIPLNEIIKISVKNCNDCEVYILNDNTTYNINTFIGDSISKGYYVYHNKTNVSLKSFLVAQGFVGKEDHHEPQGNQLAKGYYLWLNKVGLKEVENDNKKFVDEISKELFDELWNKLNENTKLETALNFLHQLNKGEIPENLPEELNAFSNAYKTFKESVNGNNNIFSEDFINALATFRDVLLNDEIDN